MAISVLFVSAQLSKHNITTIWPYPLNAVWKFSDKDKDEKKNFEVYVQLFENDKIQCNVSLTLSHDGSRWFGESESWGVTDDKNKIEDSLGRAIVCESQDPGAR